MKKGWSFFRIHLLPLNHSAWQIAYFISPNFRVGLILRISDTTDVKQKLNIAKTIQRVKKNYQETVKTYQKRCVPIEGHSLEYNMKCKNYVTFL